VDLQLESGEYFLSAEMKASKKWEAKKEKQSEKAVENKRKREASFVPPKEEKRATEISKMDVASQKDKSSSKTDVAAMAASLKSKMKNMGSSKTTAHNANGVDSYIATPSSSKKQKTATGEGSGEKRKKAKKSAE